MLLTESLLGTSSTAANYIEDVFSTYLYTGTGASQTITNGIDLSTKGGMVWLKSRSAVGDHYLFDTSRGTTKFLGSNSTNQQLTGSTTLTAFNNNGFTLGAATATNGSGTTYTSWTFRKQAKFFDVVTYTGNGTAGRQISHSLGGTCGCVIVKRTDTSGGRWAVWHTSTGTDKVLYLDLTQAVVTDDTKVRTADSTTFTVGNDFDVNASGGTYVAYLFAHDAGGFGASGSDNVISCGSYTGNGSTTGPTVTLGYEPQLVITKRSSGISDWVIFDTMRGMSETSANLLYPNLSSDEGIGTAAWVVPTATGFKLANASSTVNANGSTYIYIAIRRGPMKTPTSGTSVFYPLTQTGNATNTSVGFPADWTPLKIRNGVGNWLVYDRLRGINNVINFNATAAESSATQIINSWSMNGMTFGSSIGVSDQIYVPTFRRAPGFFDVVCYTGTGASATLNHNLGVAPNMVIIKGRSVVSNWETYLSSLGGTGGNGLAINDSGAKSGTPPVSSATATTFTLNNGVSTSSGQTYVAYLFATLSGVSKVGSYTGSGTTKQIDCGFTGGARFVLIKRTDSTGDWYVWDSARGIVAGNDPYLLLNSTAAEVTGTDYIDTYSAGFEISSTAPAAINANGGSFIFLAIA